MARERIGLIGPGRMGLAMVKHLIAARYAVTAYDVDADRLALAREAGYPRVYNFNDLEDLARQTGQPIAMRWSGQDISDEATAFLKLNLAGNWADFSAAAALFAVPGQNMVYADREGNIGWRPFVRIPIRQGGASLRLLPGASGKYDWQGYLPFEELPYLYNPPEGYIATANNPTFDDAFPTYISAYWEQPFRVDQRQKMRQHAKQHHQDGGAQGAGPMGRAGLDAHESVDERRH
ncbi:MAG: penicillin acylase family protein, partial [Proteobacteria bacterium]|nr:penicillin acylase family protein [Pseudomonadota bacterium]